MTTIKVQLCEHFDTSFPLPQYESLQAAGCDIRVSLPNKDKLIVEPGQRTLIPTGIKMEIPSGYEIQVRPRSGLSLKTNLLIVNSPGTIDADYRGEVKVIVGNFGPTNIEIEHGLRIAQIVVCPIHQAKFEVVNELSKTDRGAGGFGSTGVK